MNTALRDAKFNSRPRSRLRLALVAIAAIGGWTQIRPPHARADEPFLDLAPVGLRVYQPFDGFWFDGGHFEFSGEGFSEWDIVPQLRIARTGEWTDASGYFSGFSWDSNASHVDPTGIEWFQWHASADWPTFSEQFAGPVTTLNGQGGQRANPIELRFVNRSDMHAGSHFAYGGEQCIREHEGDGPVEARAACALSKDSVTYLFKCGRENQACCAGDDRCDADLECGGDSLCHPINQPPSNPPPSNPPPSNPTPYPGNWHTVLCSCGQGAWLWTLDYCNDAGQDLDADAACLYPGLALGGQVGGTVTCVALSDNLSSETCNATIGAVRNAYQIAP